MWRYAGNYKMLTKRKEMVQKTHVTPQKRPRAASPVAQSLVGGRLAAYGARGWRESLCSIARFNSSGISCEW